MKICKFESLVSVLEKSIERNHIIKLKAPVK